jgi:hypothetical protein
LRSNSVNYFVKIREIRGLSTKTQIIAIFNLFFCTVIAHFLQNNALHCPIKNTYYDTKSLR